MAGLGLWLNGWSFFKDPNFVNLVKTGKSGGCNINEAESARIRINNEWKFNYYINIRTVKSEKIKIKRAWHLFILKSAKNTNNIWHTKLNWSLNMFFEFQRPAEGILVERWYDPRLIHENRNKDLPYLNAIHHKSDIWSPPKINAESSIESIEVYPNGTVISVSRLVL